MTYVQVEQRVTVEFLKETPEVKGPRGWAEAAIVPVEIEREHDGLLLKFSSDTYLVPAEVVEALYDVWQEVPVGSSKGRDQ